MQYIHQNIFISSLVKRWAFCEIPHKISSVTAMIQFCLVAVVSNSFLIRSPGFFWTSYCSRALVTISLICQFFVYFVVTSFHLPCDTVNRR